MIPRWDAVQVAMDAFDPLLLRRALWPTLRSTELGPIVKVLTTTLTPWYDAGPVVGDETVTGWCWCHSFRGIRGTGEALWTARHDAIAEEVQAALDWRRSWIGVLPRLPRPDDHPEDGLMELVGHLIDLGLHDAWYVHIDAVTMWWLDAAGVPRSPQLADTICDLTEAHFTSWVAPVTHARRQFAEEAAWKLVEHQLDRDTT